MLRRVKIQLRTLIHIMLSYNQQELQIAPDLRISHLLLLPFLVATLFHSENYAEDSSQFLNSQLHSLSGNSYRLGIAIPEESVSKESVLSQFDQNWDVMIVGLPFLEWSSPERRAALKSKLPGKLIITAVAHRWTSPPGDIQILTVLPKKLPNITHIESSLKRLFQEDIHSTEEFAEFLVSLDELFESHSEQPLVFCFPDYSKFSAEIDLVQPFRGLPAQSAFVGFPVCSKSQTTTVGDLTAIENLKKQARITAWDRLQGVYGIPINGAMLDVTSLHSGVTAAVEMNLLLEDLKVPNVITSLRKGHFYLDSSNQKSVVILEVITSKHESPLQVGDECRLPVGSSITVKLSYDSQSANDPKAQEWLDSLELTVIEQSEVTTLVEDGIFSGRFDHSWNLVVPDDGLVLRAKISGDNATKEHIGVHTNAIRIMSDAIPARQQSSTPIIASKWLGTLVSIFVCFLVALIFLRQTLMHKKPTRLPGNSRANRHVKLVPTNHEKENLKPKVLSDKKLETDIDWSPPEEFVVSEASSLQNVNSIVLPSRRHFALAAILTTLFIIYGLLVPLNYQPRSLESALDRFKEIPYLNIGVYGRQDWVANLLLFIPLGIFSAGSVIVDRIWVTGSRLLAFFILVPALCGLAIGTEFLQLWYPPRTVSQNDIIAESIGGAIGVFLAICFLQTAIDWSRRLLSKASLQTSFDWLLGLYFFTLVISMLIPFDFVLNAKELQAKIDRGSIAWNIVPLSRDEWASCLITLLVFAPIGFLIFRVFLEHKKWRPVSCAAVAIIFAALVEISQIPIFSRKSSLVSFYFAAIGGVLGIYFYPFISNTFVEYLRRHEYRKKRQIQINIGLTLLYSIFLFVFYRGTVIGETNGQTMLRLQNFWKIPFARLYWGSELNAFFFVLRNVLLLLPVGFLLGDISLSAGNPNEILRRAYFSSFLVAGFAALLEVAQAWSEAHFTDVTDAFLLAIGGLAGLLLRLSIDDFMKHGLNFGFPRLANMQSTSVLILIGSVSLCTTGYSSIHTVRVVSNIKFDSSEQMKLVVDEVVSSANLQVENIVVPTPEHPEAIWGSTGRDSEGNIWIGVSDGRSQRASARILKLTPSTGTMSDVSNIRHELGKVNLSEDDLSQAKVHSKFVEADDGYVYFSSMDEQGEASDGSQLPTWGSHLWRIHPVSNEIEHLKSVPEGLIASTANGDSVYFLGLFDHVLYRWDIVSDNLTRVVVGALGGHISRNLLSDRFEHAYVPAITFNGFKSDAPKNPVSSDKNVKVELVQFNKSLHEIGRFELPHYLTNNYWSNHGITAICNSSNGHLYFTTSTGRLFRILPQGSNQKSTLQDLGWFHPKGSAYAPSLFQIDQRQFAGAVIFQNQYDWVVFDLESMESTATQLPLPKKVQPANDLLLYGSQTRDEFGGCYLVGRLYNTPVAIRVIMRE